MTPAEDFAAMFADEATAPEAVPDVVEPTPRAPAPNAAQGASGRADPPKPNPAQAFIDALNDTYASRRGDGGWHPR